MNEVVKYHNDLNSIRLGHFSETQMNILFTIFAKIRDKKTSEITLKIDEIIELSNIQTSNKQQLNDTIFNTFRVMQGLTFRWNDEKAEGQSVAFYEIVREYNKDELIIKINPKFSYLFNNLVSNFTKYELAEFVSLDSRYAKTLYRLLKQFRSTGYLKIEWDSFIDIMDIPKNYRMYDIERQILKPNIKKLSSERNLFDQKRTPFTKLTYKKLKTKGKGNKVTHIEFNFNTENIDNKKTIKIKDQKKQVEKEKKDREFKYQFYGKNFKIDNVFYSAETLEKKGNDFLLQCNYYDKKDNESKSHIWKFQNLEQIKELISEHKKNNPVKFRPEIEKMFNKK